MENWTGVILAAAIAGIGSGVGVAIGQALYKAFFENKVEAILDRQKRKDALQKIVDQPNIITEKFKSNGTTVDSKVVLDRMLGRK